LNCLRTSIINRLATGPQFWYASHELSSYPLFFEDPETEGQFLIFITTKASMYSVITYFEETI
jgi:hypothetical protein